MTSTENTFAGQLRHFARAVDIVDDQIFDGVRKLVYKYVKDELGAVYFELMQGPAVLDGDPALKMFWSLNDCEHLWPVTQADGSYTNPVTMAYAKQTPLWIVDQDERPRVRCSTSSRRLTSPPPTSSTTTGERPARRATTPDRAAVSSPH